MRGGKRAIGAIVLLAAAARGQSPPIDSSVCAECHPTYAQSYGATGMARSFFRPAPANKVENYANAAYYHSPSDTWFEMVERSGKYFQRQYQVAFSGKQTNLSETEIDFVMGSGNHARTYLHRTADNQLMELPLGWYAEAGGYWAMNPGYDRPDHAGLSRAIPNQCMFCHNGYPEVPSGRGPRAPAAFRAVPQGIDCQRCHGDGARHVQMARTASPPAEIRQAIVNPSRLSFERQIEVCLQCHLEPNSAATSSLLVRYEREPFSFKPGEALADFRLHFDQKPNDDRFEIVGSSAYRLMQSQCFLKSRRGALTCTTCHDPHSESSPRNVADTCARCHAAKLNSLVAARRHPDSPDCAGCHMPKRRTEDAVHVGMTDHRIQRSKPARDLLAPLRDEVHPDNGGAVLLWYPSTLTNPSDELYLGVAQVGVAGSRTGGIARLSAAIRKFQPPSAEYYLQLGDALRASRRFAEAIAPYEEAVRREPQSAVAHERLAFGLTRVQQFARADAEFSLALQFAPADAVLLKDIGLAYLEQGRMVEATAAFEKSLALDSSLYEAHNGLGGARLKLGDKPGAEAEFRKAIQLRPHYAQAHHNLAFLLSTANYYEEAGYHFEESLRLNPDNPETHFDYAAMLARSNQPEKARRHLDAVLRANPRHSGALALQANLRRTAR